MNAIELLSEYAKLAKRVRLLENQIEAKREMAASLSGWPEGDRVQTSHEPDKIGRVVAMLADKEAELVDLKLELIDRMNDIEIRLRELKDPEGALVLQYRYIRGWLWDDIAREMHCTPRWAQELKRKAIKEMDRRMR
ncbi:MAG: hypothetical protein IJI87_07575 [Mogibacterium sp.]|nr:hypothetical protein [Mogibacterium sp.]